jgi:hypothetical protein
VVKLASSKPSFWRSTHEVCVVDGVGAGAFCLLVTGVRAADKEVTLKGEILCALCELKEGSKCQTVIKVQEGGQEVLYYFKDKGKTEKWHEAVHGGGRKAGTVMGTVSEKDGKKWITPTKVEYDKK